MIYLDYAANTPVDEKVLDVFVDATRKYHGNPNSSHDSGVEARKAIEKVSKYIGDYFHTDANNIIYTSGSSESNNMVLKGIALKKGNEGKNIIISAVEHSSIVAPCNYLADLGYDVTVLPLDSNGMVDLEKLKEAINEDTILVSICSVDSELGTVQPISEISKIVGEYPNCVFHTDATQAIGKANVDFSGVDFITFAPHKFFGLNGFGVLVDINNIKLVPLIHGGKSTTMYRSGTPVTANVVALGKAFELAVENLEERTNYLKGLNSKLREFFGKYNVHINSPKNAIPNTLNVSLIDIRGKDMIDRLNEKEIYVSSTTACALGNLPSKSVLAITGSEELAANTIRISISHMTTMNEINDFMEEFDKIYKELDK